MDKPKRRRDRRAKIPKQMELTSRDIDIVECVHRFRVLRQDQIQQLYFGPRNKSGAQQRLEKLFDHGFLERRFLPVSTGRSPTLYILDRRGAELLRAERGYDELTWYGSRKDLKEEFLAHTLAINDVMVAFILACQQQGFTLETWLTENQMKADYDRVTLTTSSGRREAVPIVPDSYFTIIAHERRYPLFLELDRGTMTINRFKTKVLGYQTYLRSGAYEKRFKMRSLRVLTVTLGKQRLTNLKEATEQLEGVRWFWFALLSDLNIETILQKPVWSVAGKAERDTLILLEE